MVRIVEEKVEENSEENSEEYVLKTCAHCLGSGQTFSGRCAICGGKGMVKVAKPVKMCRACFGKGAGYDGICSACGGSGWENVLED